MKKSGYLGLAMTPEFILSLTIISGCNSEVTPTTPPATTPAPSAGPKMEPAPKPAPAPVPSAKPAEEKK